VCDQHAGDGSDEQYEDEEDGARRPGAHVLVGQESAQVRANEPRRECQATKSARTQVMTATSSRRNPRMVPTIVKRSTIATTAIVSRLHHGLARIALMAARRALYKSDRPLLMTVGPNRQMATLVMRITDAG